MRLIVKVKRSTHFAVQRNFYNYVLFFIISTKYYEVSDNITVEIIFTFIYIY